MKSARIRPFGGHASVSSIVRGRPSPYSPLEDWYRHLSSLRSTKERHDGSVAQESWWKHWVPNKNSWRHRWAQDASHQSEKRQGRVVSNDGGVFVFEAWSRLCDEGELQKAFHVVDKMEHHESCISLDMLYRLLQGCIAKKDLVLGKRVHALAVSTGHELNMFLANRIIRMYGFHGDLLEAARVFSKLPKPNAFCWTSIISAYAENGQPKQAVTVYQQMRKSSVLPDDFVYVAVLKACASAADLKSGRLVHADVIDSGFECNVYVANTLVDMYCKCGSLEDARVVFDRLPTRDMVSWNAMIAGYSHHGLGQEALQLFARMEQYDMTPDKYTFVSVLKSCGSTAAIQDGKLAHAQIQRRRLESDVFIGNALVDMYSKCGCLEEARSVFDRLNKKDVVTWSAMITGYAQQGLGQEAIELYRSMEQDGTSLANDITFVGILKACGSLGAIKEGKQIHAQILERELESETKVGNALVDMYVKCGSVDEGRTVFDRLKKKDVVSWTALIKGYGQHNKCGMALQCFEEMRQRGVEPDSATFTCLLAACSHVGLVEEARQYFKEMVDLHGITPIGEHYTCMVDALSRSGKLEEAQTMLQSMPCRHDSAGWRALLSACKVYGNIEIGRRCFDHIFQIEPEHPAAYTLMSEMYADAGKWEDERDINHLRRSAGIQKKPAMAAIEVDNKVHEFVVGEKRADLSAKLKSLTLHARGTGHVSPVLGALPEDEKEDALCGHAEKLALAFGLLNTPPGTSLLIVKNLRMCDHCHSGTKTVSRVEKREIIVRDAHRVHHFSDGLCSCGDHK